MTRLVDYLRFVNRFAGTLLLLAFWGLLLFAFVAHMAPRFAYLAGAPIGVDLPCLRPQCDFSVFWPAGWLANMHDFTALYTPKLFVLTAGKLLLPHVPYETFFYPPTVLLVLGPLAHLPFEIAAFVWIFGSTVLAILLLRLAGFEWLVIIAGLLAPSALLDYQLGQFGVLSGAILLASIRFGLRYPFQGGSLGGLLVIKPQLGVLLPFLWIKKRSWTALAGGLGVALGLVILSLLLFGPSAWYTYLTQGRAQSFHVLSAPFDPHGAQGWGVSVFWMIRSFGGSVHEADFIQMAVAIIALLLLFRLRWRPEALCAGVVCLSLLVTPYANTPDMVAFSLMQAEAARQRGWRIGLLDAFLFLWPGLCLVVSIATGHELTPFIVLAALLRAALPARLAVLPAPAQE